MSKFFKAVKIAASLGAAAGVSSFAGMQLLPKYFESRKRSANAFLLSAEDKKRFESALPNRNEMLQKMNSETFDILIIGGGATGTGIAVDAASRGLKTCLVEKYDFASGTSSKSTKLIHGGVRYLQKAVFNLDIEQFRMVMEALSERANLLRIAPHIATDIPIMLPLYKWWQIPYYWAGIKMYDVVSGPQILKASYALTRSQALEQFPMLNKNDLKGALVYYDGQQDDARMCLSLAITAARYGATLNNYTEVRSLTSDPDSKMINGAVVKDAITGNEFKISAKCVVNATGPFTDSIRGMCKDTKPNICQPSSGVHIVLPGHFCPPNMGLLDPATRDGRVIFFLPYQNCTVAGTTDVACKVTHSPSPTEEEIQFILEDVVHYLSPDTKITREDVQSAWSGIRPLVKDPNSPNTQSLARNHIIEVSNDGLITIAGGKWTTYRHMAEETVDQVYALLKQEKKGCRTMALQLEGAHGYSDYVPIRLKIEFGLDNDVAKHLASTYGDKSFEVIKLGNEIEHKRLHEEFPFIEAEVRYACKEYACKIVDIIARRVRIAFLNAKAAQETIPRIAEIMAEELHWDEQKKRAEIYEANCFVNVEMGLGLNYSGKKI